MAATIKYGDTKWAVKDGNTLGYNDENRFKPVPFDFTRNSIGTRVDRNGLIETIGNNIPRIDFTDNTDGHLLLEPQSTNLVGYSLPNDTNWGKGSNTTITENYAVSPDGTQNASRLVMPTGSGTYAYYQFTATSTTNHTLSFYAKNNGGDADVTMAFFVASQTQTITLTNEWQRFEFTTSITSGNTVQVGVDNIASVDMLIFGVQCEALSYATSYIPTNGSTVTRDAETCTNAGNSTLINSTEGVLYAEIAALADDGLSKRITISDATLTNRIALTLGDNNISGFINVNNVSQYTFFESITTTNFNKIAIKFKANDFAVWINGVEYDVDTSGITFSANTLNVINFANATNTSNQFYGNCKALAVFNVALSDSELTQLTS